MKSYNIVWFWILFIVSFVIVFFVKYDIQKTVDQYWDVNIEKKLVFSSEWYKYFRKWLDVAWGIRLTYKIDFTKYEQVYTDPQQLAKVKKQVKEIIKRNIENRISWLWVSDYYITIINLNWQDYLQVEIWWIHDIEYAKKVIWKTVELEFKVPYQWEDKENAYIFRKKLAENILQQAILSGKSLNDLEDIDNGIYYFSQSIKEDNLPQALKDKIDQIESLPNEKVYPTLISGQLEIVYPRLFQQAKNMSWWFIVKKIDGNRLEYLFITAYPFWILAKDSKTWQILNGAYFKYATVAQNQKWQFVVEINFDDIWKEIFCDITKRYLEKPMAIFVWNRLVTSPNIKVEICGWTAMIEWMFTSDEAKKLAKDLNEWALPAKLILSQEEKISPVLWEKALIGAVIAGFVGFGLIYLLLLFMYGFKWANLAILSLIEFVIVVLAVVKITDYALSLSGIAAILLSIGIAVDANILIYERVKEELKDGNSFYIAVKNWLERSWNAIRDGNLTTGMIALILFMIGMNVFKWFGTMMLLNIFVTLVILVPFVKNLLLLFGDIENKN